MSLYTGTGERKYLAAAERARFLDSLSVLTDPKDRTFCEMIYWTGCRPSEALGLRALHIDLQERMVIFRSLKKRGPRSGKQFRAVPAPEHFIEALDDIHGLRAAQASPGGGAKSRLWTFCRTTGWARMNEVMAAAGLSGVKASAKGLRHAYGVHAAMMCVPETRIKAWLGHESLETTAIYLDVAAPEDRAIAERMWSDE